MALVIKDRVRQTSTTAGTGTITLSGSVTGYQDFTVIGTGNTTYYTIADQSGSNWEVGLGTWTSPNQLSRDIVYESSNGNALVNFGSNIKDVFVTLPAEGFASPPAIGGTTPNTITGTVITAKDGGASAFVIDDSNSTGVTCTFNIDQITYSPVISATDGTLNYPLQVNSGLFIANNSWLQLGNADNSAVIYIKAPTSFTTYYLTLPTTTGSANQVLKTDGTGVLSWVTPNAGTVTSVGGTGTVNGLTLTGTVTGSGNLTLGGTLSLVSPPAIGSTTPNTGAFTTLTTTGAVTTTAVTDPTAPANGNLSVYAKQFGGYTTLAARNALNASFGLQSALWSKNIQMWTNTNSTVGSWINQTGTSSGTFTAVSPTAGSTLYQTLRRSTYANVITSTNQILGIGGTYLSYFRGSVAGQGGFFFHARCGFDVWTNGGRFFAGMSTNNTTIVSNDPSSNNNTVGFCVDAADNGAISFLTRGTAATKASTGYTITSNKGYDLYVYCSPNSSQYTWMIVDINAGTSATGTATANLPTNTQTQVPNVSASNAALTTATAISLGIAKVYCESDY